jgi:rhamnosyltransferase
LADHSNSPPFPTKSAVLGPHRENTCAIVVTYHPSPETLSNLTAIAPQVAHVVVVDNGSSEEELVMLRNFAAEDARLSLIENEDNLGIATALNRGMEWAQKNGFAWTISFDQDSAADADLVATVSTGFARLSQPESIGAIGVNARNEITGKLVHPLKDKRTFFVETKTVITSGCLIRTSTWEQVGRFKDEYFIDCVDHEFCLRLRKKGLRVFVTSKPLMKHRLGQDLPDLPWGHGIHMTPLRRYYLSRNVLLLGSEYLFREPAWVLSSVVRTIFAAAVIKVPFEKEGGKKLRAIALGFWHALIGRTGRLPER